MTDPDYTALALVVDRSGSMGLTEAIRADAEGGVNAFVEAQKRAPGRATLTLTQFDYEYELLERNVPLDEVKPYHLHPRGRTALWDAVAQTVVAVGEDLAALPEDQRPDKVLVAIMTDGAENHSQEWTDPDQLRALLDHQRDVYGWEFLYLSADPLAVQHAYRLGFKRNQTYAFDPGDAGVAYAAASAGVTKSRAGGDLVVDDGQ